MSIRLRIVGACLLFVLIMSGLGLFARSLESKMSNLAISIYDNAFIGVNYTHIVQTGFVRFAGERGHASGAALDDAARTQIGKLIDNLDVANERAMSDKSRALAKSIRDRLTAMRSGPAPGDATLAQIDKDLGKLVTNYAADAFAYRGRADDLVNESDHWLMSAIGVALGLAIVIAFGLIRSIVPPIKRAVAIAGAIAEGRLDNPIASRGRSEPARLLAALAVMQDSIARNLEKVEALRQAQEAHHAAGLARQKEIDRLVAFFGSSVGGVLTALSTASTDMAVTSESLETSAAETGCQTRLVMTEVGQTAATVQSAAAASQQLSASIDEIGRQASESSRIASAAMEQTENVVTKVADLRSAASQIGTVVSLINNIAKQTNLLALNATIEAARAGDAGRGFAVVANEVKSLAQQTARATDEIGGQIDAIRDAVVGAADSIQGIAGTVHHVNEIAMSIASAVIEQGAATQEITRSVEVVSTNTASIADSMVRVGAVIGSNGHSAAEVTRTARTLSEQSGSLSGEVTDFLAALQSLSGGQTLQCLDVDLPATVTFEQNVIAGRVRKLSPGFALFVGRLSVPSGTLLEIRIQGVDRKLAARFVEFRDGGSYVQLPLNRENLAYMEQVVAGLGMAAAA
jgi:methyl-accepting chemotaxis protein